MPFRNEKKSKNRRVKSKIPKAAELKGPYCDVKLLIGALYPFPFV